MSVRLAALSQSSVCMQYMTVCAQMHACEHLYGAAACLFLPRAHIGVLVALHSFHHHRTSLLPSVSLLCLEFTVSLWGSGTLRPPGRRPMRRGRSG